MHLGLNPAALKMSLPSRGADPRRIREKTTVPIAGGGPAGSVPVPARSGRRMAPVADLG